MVVKLDYFLFDRWPVTSASASAIWAAAVTTESKIHYIAVIIG